MFVRLNIDGGVRTGGKNGPTGGSTGPASIGFVITDEDGVILLEAGMAIGEATVNEAEYSALISGLYNCELLGASKVEVRGDSQVVIRQMQGVYAVRSPTLVDYHAEAKLRVLAFEEVVYEWVPRSQNKLADLHTEQHLGRRK